MKLLGHLHRLYAWWLRHREQNAADDRPAWTADQLADMRACVRSQQRHRRRHPENGTFPTIP